MEHSRPRRKSTLGVLHLIDSISSKEKQTPVEHEYRLHHPCVYSKTCLRSCPVLYSLSADITTSGNMKKEAPHSVRATLKLAILQEAPNVRTPKKIGGGQKRPRRQVNESDKVEPVMSSRREARPRGEAITLIFGGAITWSSSMHSLPSRSRPDFRRHSCILHNMRHSMALNFALQLVHVASCYSCCRSCLRRIKLN